MKRPPTRRCGSCRAPILWAAVGSTTAGRFNDDHARMRRRSTFRTLWDEINAHLTVVRGATSHG